MANKKNRQRRSPSGPRPTRGGTPFTGGDVRSSSFWSYVRDDDTALFGKLGELKDDIRGIYKLMTGDIIEIFMDRDDIGWGQQWDQVIQRGITRTVFMLPLITPSYFRSDACREELLKFNSLCAQRGLTELILPIVVTGIERISSESDDEIVRIIAAAQYEDFTEVWPYSRGGEEWILGVRRLVTGLIEAEKRVDSRLLELLDERSVIPGDDADPEDVPDTEMGMAEFMEALNPSTQAATIALNEAVQRLDTFASALRETSLGSGSSSADPRQFQIQIATTAHAIKESAAALEEAGANALEKVSDTDKLVVGLIQALSGMHDKQFLESFRSSMGDVTAVCNAVGSMNEMIRQLSDVERLSSVLRRELRPARRGMQFLRDAAKVFLSWTENQ